MSLLCLNNWQLTLTIRRIFNTKVLIPLIMSFHNGSVNGNHPNGDTIKTKESYIHQEQRQQHDKHPRSMLEHLSLLDIDVDPAFVRQTTLVCSLGIFPHFLYDCLGKSWNNSKGIASMIRKGMNIVRINMRSWTEKEILDSIERIRDEEKKANYNSVVAIAIDISGPPVDFVFTPYATDSGSLIKAKSILGNDINLFAKIDNRLAVNNLQNTLEIVDGLVIDRGNLSLCYPVGKAPKLQKQMIAMCNVVKKPVFVITQLLDSMINKPRATRAEISDVGNAVVDGVDGLVLTDETSIGLYPENALNVLHVTAREAESTIFHNQFWFDLKNARDACRYDQSDPVHITALAAVEASAVCSASAIFVISTSGKSAFEISAFRPSCPVIAIVRLPDVARRCHAFRGIHPFVYTGDKCELWSQDMDARLNAALAYARRRDFVSPGDHIVFVTGHFPGQGSTNTVQVFQVPTSKKPMPIVDSKSRFTEDAWVG